jgi:hypothetical protein
VKRAVLVGIGILAIPIVVLGYGYWLGVSHGSLSVYVTDITDREHSRPVSPVTLAFLNAGGRTLAMAAATDPLGTVYLSSPATYSCRDAEQRAPFSVEARKEWDQCLERQSRWIPTWIKSVKYLDLHSGPCTLHNIPVAVSEDADAWWLWWVPMPHIGGKPYTSFNVSIQVDANACAVVREKRG